MKAEHEEHLRGPAAEPLDLDDGLDHGFVAQLMERVNRQLSARDLRGEIPEVSDLLPAQSRASHLLVGQREHGPRRNTSRHQRHQASVDRRRGFRRQLLTGDRPDERRKRIHDGRVERRSGPVLPDDWREDRIAPHQRAARPREFRWGHGDVESKAKRLLARNFIPARTTARDCTIPHSRPLVAPSLRTDMTCQE